MNNNFTKETVKKLADLLLIGLSDEETEMVFDEFEVIDADINKINEIEGIENIEPMTHALDHFEFNLRDDVIKESVEIDELLRNSDDTDDREISVPKVVG